MKKWISVVLILGLCFSLASCAFEGDSEDLMKDVTSQDPGSSALSDVASQDPISSESSDVVLSDPLDFKDFSSVQRNFSVKLFQKTVEGTGAENVLISPLSVSLALSMATNGAEGKTQSQMLQTLCGGAEMERWNQSLFDYVKSLTSSESAKIKIANSVWFRNEEVTVKPEFLQKASDYYGASAYKSPFDAGTVKDINRWVKTNTDGMIEKIIDRIDRDVMLYLINALTFESDWQNVYKKHQVSDGFFTTADGTKQKAEMMHDTLYTYLETDGAVGFVKDYADGEFRFVALLPDEGTAVNDFVATLTEKSLSTMMENVIKTKVITKMPKFSYDYSVEMRNILRSMGMSDAFDRSAADFSQMGTMENGENLFLGKVLHKTHIEVGEKGTRAAAITVIEVPRDTAMPPQEEPKTVILDRPFFFMIVDGNENIPLFMGIVNSME